MLFSWNFVSRDQGCHKLRNFKPRDSGYFLLFRLLSGIFATRPGFGISRFWDFLSRNDFDLQGDLSIVFLKSHLFLVRGLTEAVFLERQRSYLINLGISNRS